MHTLRGYDGSMDTHSEHSLSSTSALVQDPVCGMDVDPATSERHLERDGHDYYFCSAGCHATFEAQPQAYLAGPARHAGSGHDPDAHDPDAHDHTAHPRRERSSDAADAGLEVAEWTCPMHPEIRRPGPGTCPICGMALEPVTVTAGSGPNPELTDITRRFWVGVALSIPVFLLGMGGDLFPALHEVISARASNWVQLV